MLPAKQRVKREKSAAQALSSLMRLCARAERSSGDAKRLMATWGVPEGERAGVLQQLIADRFIDDRRYAEAFVREKSNLSGWGEYKIRAALMRKGITADIIAEALKQINTPQNLERLHNKLEKRMRTVKYSSPYDLRNKLIRSGLSLGFAMDDVLHCVEQLTQKLNFETECDVF